MMGSLNATCFHSKQLFPFVNATTPQLVFRAGLLHFPRSQTETRHSLYGEGRHNNVQTRVIGSEEQVQGQQGVWEDPDDGSSSDYDEDEEDQQGNDYDVNFESNWEEDKGASAAAANTYEEDLVREVEQLLSPEEKAILQQNETPSLQKISTAKWHPFHTLALSGQITFMDQLLETLQDIDAIDRYGHTALHKAIIGKKEAVISHLLRKGANPHMRDQDGATPLHYAVQAGAVQTAKLLIKYNVDVNIADNEGWTPLHVAVQSRNRTIIKMLLVNGADETRRNKDGKTPLDLCLCYGRDFKSYELAKLVKEVPANRKLL